MNVQVVNALPAIESNEISIDIETTVMYGKNADPFRDRILSVQVSDGKQVWMLHNNYVSLIPLLTNPDVKKLFHNGVFDIKFLKYQLGGIEISNVYDTLLIERLITAGRDDIGNGLGEVLARRCGVFTDKSIRNQFSEHSGQFTEEQLKYAATDVYYLSEIRKQQLDDISKAGMGKVVALENAVLPVVVDMELDGVGFDRGMWKEHVLWLEKKKQEIKLRMCEYLDLAYSHSLFGGIEIELNLNSNDQVKEQLYKLGCKLPSTGEKVIEAYKYEYPTDSVVYRFITDLLEWRSWEKLLGYDYPKYINPITGNIHCSWNQINADTGRFSSSEPNLQNVPRPVKGQPNFRELFPPEEGYVYVIADYSQQEVRILAEISKDDKLIAATESDDIYCAMGEAVFNHPVIKGTEERHHVKTAVLGDIYGGGAKRLAAELSTTIEKATELKQKMRSAFPKAYSFLDSMGQQVMQRGFVTTILGRRRLILNAIGASKEDSWAYINQAKNMPIQGTAADIGKRAMVEYTKWAKENDYNNARIALAVHDELVVKVPKDQADEIHQQVRMAMITSMESLCPNVRAEVESGIKERWTKV